MTFGIEGGTAAERGHRSTSTGAREAEGRSTLTSIYGVNVDAHGEIPNPSTLTASLRTYSSTPEVRAGAAPRGSAP
jgi:hypothetical protein